MWLLRGHPAPVVGTIATAGLLARGSPPGSAFPGHPSGTVDPGSPPTVAGAAPALARGRTGFPLRPSREPSPLLPSPPDPRRQSAWFGVGPRVGAAAPAATGARTPDRSAGRVRGQRSPRAAAGARNQAECCSGPPVLRWIRTKMVTTPKRKSR
jgi:hypothetical protein